MNGAYQFLKKNGVTISFALGALLAIISIVVIVAGFPADATKEALYASPVFNTALNITYILIGVCVFVAVFGAIHGTTYDIKFSLPIALVGAVLTLFVNIFLVAIILLVVVAVLDFFVVGSKVGIKFYIITVIMAIMYGISRAMASSPSADELVVFQGNHNKHLVESDVVFVDGLLLFTTIMISLAILAWAFSIVWGFIKQR